MLLGRAQGCFGRLERPSQNGRGVITLRWNTCGRAGVRDNNSKSRRTVMWKKLKSWGQNERRGFVMLRCAKHERDEICRVLQGPARSRSGLYTGVYDRDVRTIAYGCCFWVLPRGSGVGCWFWCGCSQRNKPRCLRLIHWSLFFDPWWVCTGGLV